MARVRSIARVTGEGEETGTSKTASISEMMRRFELVVQEDTIVEGVVDADAEPTIAETDSENEDEDDESMLNPNKPSHIEFWKSTVKAKLLILMKKL
jgi:hypothetical protein